MERVYQGCSTCGDATKWYRNLHQDTTRRGTSPFQEGVCSRVFQSIFFNGGGQIFFGGKDTKFVGGDNERGHKVMWGGTMGGDKSHVGGDK